MRHHEPNPSDPADQKGWTDAQLERLLSWFLQEEMPAALRDASPSAVPRLNHDKSQYEIAAARRQYSQGRWMISLCGIALLACGWLLMQLPESRLKIGSASVLASIVEWEAASLPEQWEQSSLQGDSGNFMHRAEIRWVSNGYFEPASGDWMEWSAPELLIDIEPIAESDSSALPRGF